MNEDTAGILIILSVGYVIWFCWEAIHNTDWSDWNK